MKGYSKVILVGNLTKEPELRYLPSGQPIVNFTVAVNRNYIVKSSGERKEEVSFIPVEVWGKTAEVCNQYLKKGRAVLVEGRLRQRAWEGPDGIRRNVIEVVANTVQFLSPVSPIAPQNEVSEPEIQQEEETDSELPF